VSITALILSVEFALCGSLPSCVPAAPYTAATNEIAIAAARAATSPFHLCFPVI